MLAVSAVESLRSLNTSVTTLRTSVGGNAWDRAGAGASGADDGAAGGGDAMDGGGGPLAAGVASGVPQKPHRRNLPGFSSPQLGQATVSGTGCSAVPQKPHRRNFDGFSSPQPGHRTVSTVRESTVACLEGRLGSVVGPTPGGARRLRDTSARSARAYRC